MKPLVSMATDCQLRESDRQRLPPQCTSGDKQRPGPQEGTGYGGNDTTVSPLAADPHSALHAGELP